MKTPGLAKDPSFQTFRGGTMFRSHRFVAKEMGLIMMAMILRRLSVKLRDGEHGKGLLEEDENMSFLGDCRIKNGEDVVLNVRERYTSRAW